MIDEEIYNRDEAIKPAGYFKEENYWTSCALPNMEQSVKECDATMNLAAQKPGSKKTLQISMQGEL